MRGHRPLTEAECARLRELATKPIGKAAARALVVAEMRDRFRSEQPRPADTTAAR